MKLVIVESPAKAKTINKYLGKDYMVLASFGHVRDLPSKNGSVVPDENFLMKYEISEKSLKHVSAIIKSAKAADVVLLATDPDREGEAISWHIAEVIKEKIPKLKPDFFRRVAFNEITKKAVVDAINNPRDLDQDLINAQQSRRALDYLVGFTLSPLLWRKLPGCRSAGRVQSVALRLISQREGEIERFIREEYWDITLDLLNKDKEAFSAKLTHIDSVKLEKFSLTAEGQTKKIAEDIKTKQFIIKNIDKKQQKRNPAPPFITSSLQQEAARKLGFSAKKTMQIAQKLYEGFEINGETICLITYMRTDGVTLSEDAVKDIRSLISKNYGKDYLPAAARIYKSKVKNAQEAHEAIRPTDINIKPSDVKDKLEADYFKLYELIWKRSVACQMENVIIDQVIAEIESKDKKYLSRANGSTIAFDGFYKVYSEGVDDGKEEENKTLPILKIGEEPEIVNINPLQHFTEPPPRYSEASLVKNLEELGIGRPSTYATILSVLQERKYVNLVKKRFVPEERGRLVTAFLEGFFKKYVEYDFTAELESELDSVAAGKLNWIKMLSNFWEGFNANVSKVGEQKIGDVIAYVEQSLSHHLFGPNQDARKCTACKDGILNLKLSKFGAFLACSNYPECNHKKQISNDNDEGENSEYKIKDNNKVLGTDPISGMDIYLKKGPYGPYLQLGEETVAKTAKGKEKKVKPKRSTLPPGVTPENVTVDLALKLLNLPLKIGNHHTTNKEILMGIGRFGPYLKHDDKFTSIPKAYDPFELSLDQAVTIIDTPKVPRARSKK